ncbi:hypothetical protein U0070_000205 [Myodes glareolus]|uniref:Resistin-like beta n=1 Tax=Myodes glareolus TaxID=447135 RepID=A0AAW0J3F0_MYOGA
MKSTICFLLIFISLLHLMIPVNTQASKDSLVNKKIQEALNGRGHYWEHPLLAEPKKLSCTSVKASGRWASCPADASPQYHPMSGPHLFPNLFPCIAGQGANTEVNLSSIERLWNSKSFCLSDFFLKIVSKLELVLHKPRFTHELPKEKSWRLTISLQYKGSDVCISCDHAGMAVTGCACGYGCGSWDVQNGNTCHCQCAGMDWTTARCCRLV